MSEIRKPSVLLLIILTIAFLSIAAYTIDVMYGMLSNLDYGASSIYFLTRIRMLFIPLFFGIILKNHKHVTFTKSFKTFTVLCLFSSIVTVLFRGFSPISLYASIWIPFITYCTGQILGKRSELDRAIVYMYIAYFLIVLYYYIFSSSAIYSNFDVHLNIVYVPLLCMLLVLFSKNKYINIAVYLIMMTVLLGSGKRAGVLVLVVAVFFHYILSFSADNSKRIRLIIGAILATIVFYILQDQLLLYFGDNRTLARFSNNSADDFSSGRIEIYEKTLAMYLNSSIFQGLIGHGFGAVEIHSPLKLSAHNDFIEVLYDYGIVGLALYSKFHISLIKTTRQLYINRLDGSYIFLFIYVCFFILSMISQLFNYPYFYILTLAIGYIEGRLLCRK